MYQKNLLTALLLACCLSPVVMAEKGDRDKPLEASADHSKIDQKTGKVVLTGNVLLVQGTMTIRADSLQMSQDADGNQFAQGNGKPVRFKQKLDKSTDWLEVESLRFDYDGKKGFLQLFDKASMQKGRDAASASKITYDLNTEEYELIGEPGNQTKMVITPQKKAAPDGKSVQ